MPQRYVIAVFFFVLAFARGLYAQGTLADYQRADGLARKARGLVVNTPGAVTWLGDSDFFWYPRAVKGGTEYIEVDAALRQKMPAFDHDKLAAALSGVAGRTYTGLTLPTSPRFYDHDKSIQFSTGGFLYQCNLEHYTCAKGNAIPTSSQGGRRANPEGPGGDPDDGLTYEFPQDGGASNRGSSRRQPGCAGTTQDRSDAVCDSFDGKWEAFIQNFNVFLKAVHSNTPAAPLSLDGSEGNYYTLRSIAWSPDSNKLVAYHTRPGYDRQVHYIESSPADQIQPKHTAISYRKPGDALDIAYPALFDVATKKEIEIDHALFPNPFAITPPVVVEGQPRLHLRIQPARPPGLPRHRGRCADRQDARADHRGKQDFHLLQRPGAEVLGRPKIPLRRRMTARRSSGLPSATAGSISISTTASPARVKNQITKGNWLVRNVDFVGRKTPDLVRGRRHDSRAGPLFHPVLPDQLRRHRPHQADRCRWHSHRLLLGRPQVLRRYLAAGRSAAGFPIAPHRGPDSDHGSWIRATRPHCWPPAFKFPEVLYAKGRDGNTDIWGIIIRARRTSIRQRNTP